MLSNLSKWVGLGGWFYSGSTLVGLLMLKSVFVFIIFKSMRINFCTGEESGMSFHRMKKTRPVKGQRASYRSQQPTHTDIIYIGN